MVRKSVLSIGVVAFALVALAATAGPVAADPTDGSQGVSNGTIAPGETTTLTVTTTMDADGGRLAISGNYSGPIAGVSLESVTVDGAEVNPLLSPTTVNGSTVVLGGTGSNATVEVVYEITAADSEGTITLNGSIVGGDTSFDLNTVDVAVEKAPLTAAHSVEASELEPGESTSATATIENPREKLTVIQSFNSTISNVSVSDVTVNGESISPTVGVADSNRTVVTLSGLNVSDSVVVSVEFSIPESASAGTEVAVGGNVTSGNSTVALETRSVTVIESDPVKRFAGNDGEVDVQDLSNAAVTYSTGELSIDDLNAVAVAYATGA